MTMATLMRMALVLTLGLVLEVSGAEAQSAPGTLIVQVSTEPPGLDLTTNPASAIAGGVFDTVQEGLIKIDRTGKMVPWLAERWYTTDSKNYTFFLRKGVRFHNGREMKAADVKFALNRAATPETSKEALISANANKVIAAFTLIAQEGRLTAADLRLGTPTKSARAYIEEVEDTWEEVRSFAPMPRPTWRHH